ncbi:HAD family hydrolase [Acinetobacter sp. GXMZU3951]
MYATGETYKNLALFDFDGTLCKKDSFTGFIFYALSKRHIVKQGLKLLPWIQAYYFNIYPAHAMRPKLFNAMFKDTDYAEIQQMAEAYAQLLIHELDAKFITQLRQHKSLGHDVVLVSASVDLYLKPLCQLLDINLICTETEVRDGRLTGYYQSADCSRLQKKIRISEHYNIAEYSSIYAYGNSEEDLEMFSLAQYTYMVGRDQTLPPLESQLKMA